MKPEELESIKQLISESSALSIVEKSEWIQLLPEMSEKQVSDLTAILRLAAAKAAATPKTQPQPAPAAPRPPQTGPQWHGPLLGSDRVDITEKELPPPPGTVSPSQQKVIEREPGKPSTYQQQKPQRPQPAAQVRHAAAQIQPQPHRPPVKAAKAADVDRGIALKTADDFLGLTPGILHGQDPKGVLDKLMRTVSDVSAETKNHFAVIYNLEQSPLYKTYVSVGVALLNDPTKSRDEVYTKLMEDAKVKKEEYMTKEEFEAFTDFRRELDKLLL